MKRSTGFTLIELLVAIAVFGILVGLAIPALNTFTRDNRMTSQINDFVTALQTTRSEAVRRSAHVVLCASTDQATCSAANDWEKGWIVFLDGSNDFSTASPAGRPASANKDVILKVGSALGGGDTLRSNFTNTGAVMYLASGATSSGNPKGSFTLCDPGDNGNSADTNRKTRALAVNVSNTGFISQATDTDSNGIVNDVFGNDVACP